MSAPRLPVYRPECNFGGQGEANHRRHAAALSRAMWGRGAEVSRITNVGERMLQYWMEPQARHPGPFEKAARLLGALLEAGSEDPFAPLVELADQFGFDLTPRPRQGAGRPEAVETTGGAAQQFGEAVNAVLRAVADGQVSAGELQQIRRECREARSALHLMERAVEIAEEDERAAARAAATNTKG